MLTWTYDELAALLQRPEGRFDHHRLTKEHGFPRPLPGFRDPLIWSRHAVTAWIEQNGTGQIVDGFYRCGPNDAAALERILAEDAAYLDGKFRSGRVTA